MPIIIQIAQPQKCALIMIKPNGLFIEAEYIEEGDLKLLQNLPIASWQNGSSYIIESAYTKKQIITSESICCIPVFIGGQVLGMVYLENFSSHVFPNENLVIELEIIVHQLILLLANYSMQITMTRSQDKVQLLNKFLPYQVIEELTQHGKIREPLSYYKVIPEATILFADLVNFTELNIPENLTEMRNFLNGFYTQFDNFTEEAGLTKIKTLGDGYMAAGGILETTSNHLDDAVTLALRMIKYCKGIKYRNESLALRIGIASGPVIVGLFGGKNNIQYDVLGETVICAWRLQDRGVPNKIHITTKTNQKLSLLRLRDDRSQQDLKGIGQVATSLIKEDESKLRELPSFIEVVNMVLEQTKKKQRDNLINPANYQKPPHFFSPRQTTKPNQRSSKTTLTNK
jgi:class 3 adenylate cyclase